MGKAPVLGTLAVLRKRDDSPDGRSPRTIISRDHDERRNYELDRVLRHRADHRADRRPGKGRRRWRSPTAPVAQRLDLLLVGRAGKALSEVTATARAAGATVQEIGWRSGQTHGRGGTRVNRSGICFDRRRGASAAGIGRQRRRIGRRHSQRLRGRIRTHLRGQLPRPRAAHRRDLRGLYLESRPRVLCCWVQPPTTPEHLPLPHATSRAGGLALTRSNLLSPAPPPDLAGDSRALRDFRLIPTPNSRFSITRTNCNVAHRRGSTSRCSSRGFMAGQLTAAGATARA